MFALMTHSLEEKRWQTLQAWKKDPIHQTKQNKIHLAVENTGKFYNCQRIINKARMTVQGKKLCKIKKKKN